MSVLFALMIGTIVGFLLCAFFSGSKYGEYENENMRLEKENTYLNGILDYYKDKFGIDYEKKIEDILNNKENTEDED